MHTRLKEPPDAFRPGFPAALTIGLGLIPGAQAQQAPPAESIHSIVVTASRTATAIEETPQRVEVISAADLQRSVVLDLTDALKKNSGVDVIQYNGMLSGVGIRGFRPETSGINTHSLVLIDGRPAGTTNLATLLLDNVARIEVLKGPASSLYGASAMGGVVNVVTKRSEGAIAVTVRAGAGSFDTYEVGGNAGGSLTPALSFDLAAKHYDRGDDYRMGNGLTRPFTQYGYDNATLRVGYKLSDRWRFDVSGAGFRALGVLLPGDEFFGDTALAKKDLYRNSADARLHGRLGQHALEVAIYGTNDKGNNIAVSPSTAADLPYLPYLTYESQVERQGAQVRDIWQWSDQHDLVVGLDLERVDSTSRSYSRTGERLSPFSADSRKKTVGLYAQQRMRFFEGRTTATIGVRGDRIETQTLDTPFKTGFSPSSASFDTFNPSVGVTQELFKGLRLRATYGTAFVPPEASQLTGFNTSIVGGRTQITQGNPRLSPEKSRSHDIGVEWSGGPVQASASYFQTHVSNRIASNIVVSNPPAPAPIVLSYANAFEANLKGLEADVDVAMGFGFSADASVVHYLQREEQLATGNRDINNVGKTTVRAGVTASHGAFDARLQARHVSGRKDNDFNLPGFPIVSYPNVTVADLHVGYHVSERWLTSIDVNNLFDTYYYEKKGYALEGRYALLRTSFDF